MLQCAEGPRQHPCEPKPEALVWIEEVAVDNSDALDPLLPITGTLRYRTTQVIHEPLAIRLTCEPPGRGSTCLYHHLLRLQPPAGTMGFTLAPIGDLRDGNGVPFVGALPLFFEIVATAEPNPHPTAGFAGQSMPGFPQPQPAGPRACCRRCRSCRGCPSRHCRCRRSIRCLTIRRRNRLGRLSRNRQSATSERCWSRFAEYGAAVC